MREACIRAVETAMGMDREQLAATYGENWDRGLEARIMSARLNAARADPESYRSLSQEQQLAEAAKFAWEGRNIEAAKNVQRAEQAILAHDRIENYRHTQVQNGSDPNGVSAIGRMVAHHYDEKDGGFVPLEDRANAGFNVAYSSMSGVFDKLNPGLWNRVLSGQWSMEPLRKAFTDALHGVEDPSIPAPVRDMAKLYHETVNALRERFNALGGVVGRLEDWGSSHNWSERLVSNYPGRAVHELQLKAMFAAGDHQGMIALRDQMNNNAQQHFVENMLRWANPRRYVHEDGTYYTSAELREFFGEAWNTIRSDGWTKPNASFPGGGVKANRGSHHRVIHLRPEAAYEALKMYSEQNILESMVGTLRRMNRDIASLEVFSANPDYMFDHQLKAAISEAAKIDPSKAQKLEAQAQHLRYLYNHVVGNNPRPANRAVSDFFATMRNIQIFKLAGSALTSITDWATMYQGAIQHRLNPLQVALNSSLAWAPKSRRFARRMGLVAETMISDLERLSGENVTARTLSAKTASGVIRTSGLSFVTNARRMGFSMTLMDSIGHLTRRYQDAAKLEQSDRSILAAKGIDQRTWDIWRAAELDNWGANHTLLTPEKIMAVDGISFAERREAAIKLLSIVNQEQDLAIITPGAREATLIRNGFGAAKPGTVLGEIARSFFLFKSFSIAFLGRQGERAAFYHGNDPTWASRGGRFGYMARLVVAMTILGALRNWIMDLANFKDPRPLNIVSNDPARAQLARKNWAQAALTGGGLGVYGDFLFAENSRGQNTFLETAAGPLGAAAGSAINLTTGNFAQAARGEETDAGAEALRFGRDNAPFTGLPYIRGFANRYLWDGLQEWANPGSVDRALNSSVQNTGANYWWLPGTNEPQRAPDLSAGVQ